MAANEVTELLQRIDAGDASAANALMPLVYAQLRDLAASYLKRERPGHTLQPTALVNEANLHLVGQDRESWQSRGHFMAVAATAMRRILVNHAKSKKRQKRGGHWERVSLDEAVSAVSATGVDLEGLDEAMLRLAAVDERKVRVVELRFFVGLSLEDICDVLQISLATVKRDWDFARTWLGRELASND